MHRLPFRYQENQKELLGSGFHFGPLVMRLLHHTSKPEAAYKMLLSPELAQTFFHFKSYQIGMDLLFRNQMYQEMVEVFSVLERRFIKLKQKNPSQQYPISCAVLYMAALYQLVSKEPLVIWVRLRNKDSRFLYFEEHARELPGDVASH